MNQPHRKPVTLQGIIRQIETRYGIHLGVQADLQHEFNTALKANDIDIAESLSVRMEHLWETLQHTKKTLSCLFRLAMERTMKRVRNQDREE